MLKGACHGIPNGSNCLPHNSPDAKADDPLDRYMAFVTNVKFYNSQEMIAIILEEYRYRWGIRS